LEAANCIGLTPSTYQYANKCYHGRITKQGRSYARRMMVEAAQFLDRKRLSRDILLPHCQAKIP
jgi:transposase